MKCDSCGPCLFPGDRLDKGQKLRRHREEVGPRRRGGATQRGRSLREGAEPQGGAVPHRGQATERAVPQRGWSHGAFETGKESQEQVADPQSRMRTVSVPVKQVGGSDQSHSMSHDRNVHLEPLKRPSLGP